MDPRRSDEAPISLADLIGEEPTVAPAESPAGDKPKRGVGRPPSTEVYTKVCDSCEQATPVTPDKWPHHQGKPYGAVCSACVAARIRSKMTVIRREDAATEANIKKLAVAEMRELAKRDVAAVARVLGSRGADAIAMLVAYAFDPESPHHTWALGKLIDRVAPEKFFAEIGAAAAGTPGAGDARPTVVVNVLPAGVQPAPGGHVIDVTPQEPQERD